MRSAASGVGKAYCGCTVFVVHYQLLQCTGCRDIRAADTVEQKLETPALVELRRKGEATDRQPLWKDRRRS